MDTVAATTAHSRLLAADYKNVYKNILTYRAKLKGEVIKLEFSQTSERSPTTNAKNKF